MERFNQGGEIDETTIEAKGYKWLVYWSLGEDDAFCSMTDGPVTIEIVNPHEWQDLCADAGRLTGDERSACDLACERLRWLIHQRDRTQPDRRDSLPG